jgi:acetylglutamate kinase
MKTAEILVEAISYIRKFHGETFVIKLGGETLLDSKIVDSIVQDMISLHALGINVVVVHGGGVEVSRAMEQYGKKPAFVKGLRVTDKETMEIVEMVLTGKTNQGLVTSINRQGGSAVGLSGKSGHLFNSKKRKSKVDLGYVGDIVKVNPKIIKTQTENGFIPVISPVGIDRDCGSLNINADVAASELAIALKASKLIILTNVDGVLDKNKKLIKRLSAPEVRKLIKNKTIDGGMIPKVQSCIKAIEKGVKRAHIVRANHHTVLQEILTATGHGTMITLKKPGKK